MKLLERENVEIAAPRSRVAPRPIAKPTIRINAHVVATPARRRSRSATGLATRLSMLAGLMGITYVSSTLAGYVMLERARQQGRHGEARATYARGEAAAARASIEALTNPATLHAWADAHGFVTETAAKPISKPTTGETRVALR